MASGADLIAFARARGLNPYVVGYVVATDAPDHKAAFLRDRGTFDFAAWNRKIWADDTKHPSRPDWFPINAWPTLLEAEKRHCDHIAAMLGAKLDDYLRRNADAAQS